MPELHVYEIVNPSDPYTLEAPSRLVACLATILLGNGAYGLEGVDGAPAAGLPFFIFSDDAVADLEDWCRREFGSGFTALLDQHRAEVAECLDSLLLGPPSMRAKYQAALRAIDDPVKRDRFREEWLDGRSSLNNIGGRAAALANGFRRELRAVARG